MKYETLTTNFLKIPNFCFGLQDGLSIENFFLVRNKQHFSFRWDLGVSLDALRKHCEKDFEGLWSCFLELLGGRDLSGNGEVFWKVIETPGHCPGQICLVSEAGIISADNVAQVGTILAMG